jgi:hypothetical protein
MEHIILSRALLQLVLMDFQAGQGKKRKEGQAVQGKVKRAPSFLPFAYLASLTSS